MDIIFILTLLGLIAGSGTSLKIIGALVGFIAGVLIHLEIKKQKFLIENLQKELALLRTYVSQTFQGQSAHPNIQSQNDEVQTAPVQTAPASILQPVQMTPGDYTQTPLTEKIIDKNPKETISAQNLFSKESIFPLEFIKKFFTTGNVVVKIGILLLFIGASFLLKLIADLGYFPVESRFILIALLSMSLIGIGWKKRQKRPDFALSLQGGGIGLLYITIFAAIKINPPLITAQLGLIFLLFAVAFSIILSVVQNSRALAILGSIGGFVAPVLASTGGGSHIALFSYYLLLNLGILGIAFKKSWKILNFTGFVFTFGIGTAWGINYYTPDHFYSVQPFLIAFILIFTLISLLFAFNQPEKFKGTIHNSLVFGVPLAGFLLQYKLVSDTQFGDAFSALAFGIFHAALALFLIKKHRKTLYFFCEAQLALSLGFGTIAIPMALGAQLTGSLWAIEGAALIWVGCRQEKLLARITGIALILASFYSISQVFHYSNISTRFLLNATALDFICKTIALFLGAAVLRRYALHSKETKLIWNIPAGVLYFIGLLVWLSLWITELSHLLIHSKELFHIFISILAATTLLLRLCYQKHKWILLRLTIDLWPITALFSLLIKNLFFLNEFGFLGGVAWSYVLITFLVGFVQDKNDTRVYKGFAHMACVWVFTIIALDTIMYHSHLFFSEFGYLIIGIKIFIPCIVILVITNLINRNFWIFAQNKKPYLLGAASPIIIWLIYKTINVSNVFTINDNNQIPHIPFLNPLELAQIFCGLLLSYWAITVRKNIPQLKTLIQIFWWILGLMSLIVISTIYARFLHHQILIPTYYLWESIEMQTGLSVIWTIAALGLMVAGRILLLRSSWLAGAILLAIVILKLFAIDLSNGGTILRVVSFIVVGILCVLIGYFAPLPPSKTKKMEKTP